MTKKKTPHYSELSPLQRGILVWRENSMLSKFYDWLSGKKKKKIRNRREVNQKTHAWKGKITENTRKTRNEECKFNYYTSQE